MRLGLLLCVLALVVLLAPDARACGIISSRLIGEKPSASHEHVLIIYDQSTETEHFIRRVRFVNADGTFGFVVPTPSLPTVHDGPEGIWARLEERCPHDLGRTEREPRAGVGTGQGFGSGHGRLGGGPSGVEVLSTKKLGDFTAFVLAATDTNAFDRWLEQHRFFVTPAMREWLDGYVKLAFHFVALRYDGKAQAVARELQSKTVRISFRTPSPYYPYREPEDTKDDKERKLLLWLATPAPMLPVASVIEGERVQVRRPFTETMPCEKAAAEALADVDKAIERLIPPGALLQTFADLKTNRTLWGDALFVPIEPRACGEACVKERLRLLPLLAPQVTRAPEAEPAALALGERPVVVAASSPVPAPSASAVAKGATAPPPAAGCAVGGAGRPRVLLPCLLGFSLLVLSRCRRARLWPVVLPVLLVAGCKRQTEQATPAPSASMAADEDPAQALARTSNDLPEVPFELPRDPARARSALLELLAGHRNDELIWVWSQPKGGGLGAIDVVAQAGLPDRQAVQERCAKDARLEGVLRYEVEFFDSRPQKVALTGAFSPGVLACARGLLLEAAFVHPDDARPVVRGFFGFGSTASEIQTYRSRLTKQLRLTGYSGPSSHRTRAPRVRMGAIKVDGALPPEVIQRIVRQN
jgi:hypothetical protein